MKLTLTARQQYEGEFLPPFWYGLSYYDFCMRLSVFHPIPLNYLIRVGRVIQNFWNKFRSRPTWIDRQIACETERVIRSEQKAYGDKLERMLKIAIEGLEKKYRKDYG